MNCIAECLDCGHRAPYFPTSHTCPSCGSQWREARYDYDTIKRTLPAALASRPFNLWRYLELLPVHGPNPLLMLGEGGTPLIHAANLGMMLGCPNIYIKDERQGPTASFKDRQAALTITALKEAGVTEAVLASTGNVAIAYSAYAARAGIKLWTFLTSLVPPEKMREVALYGTQVVKVTASYDQTKQVAAEFARQRDLHFERGSRSIPSVEAMKTIAFEVVEQLTDLLGAPLPATPANNRKAASLAARGLDPIWRAPDWYIQAVSGGLGPHGVQKGFLELRQMGLIDRLPALAGIQTEGCSPMAHAWKQNLETADPIRSPRTHITTLSTGDPGRTYTILRQRMLQGSGGIFESVTDEEAFRTIHILGKMEGISMEPAAAVAFAGLIKLVRLGRIKPTDVVVVNCSGHTMAVEKMILGEGWSRDITLPQTETLSLAVDRVVASSVADTPEEGLLSALSRVTSERFSRIAIVDDTPDARRLIRRILQSQGNYTLYEASNGREAIELIRNQLPDLINLDLMMPEVDGFAVLDALKTDPSTDSIPVIVVTAKELTTEEKTRLQGHIHSLMQKGAFMSDELLDEVTALLK
jgi:threonine synthase